MVFNTRISFVWVEWEGRVGWAGTETYSRELYILYTSLFLLNVTRRLSLFGNWTIKYIFHQFLASFLKYLRDKFLLTCAGKKKWLEYLAIRHVLELVHLTSPSYSINVNEAFGLYKIEYNKQCTYANFAGIIGSRTGCRNTWCRETRCQRQDA